MSITLRSANYISMYAIYDNLIFMEVISSNFDDNNEYPIEQRVKNYSKTASEH